jgi:hypothetical protein
MVRVEADRQADRDQALGIVRDLARGPKEATMP